LDVTASYKNRAHGAFHGSSSKQSLVFLEPGECLEVNAEVALLREEETKEIRRILKALTAQLAPLREPLMASAERLIDLDFLNAKARFAFDEGACLPTVHRYGKGQDRRIPLPPVQIAQGINPVLRQVQAGRGKPVVPLQLTLGDPHRLVVISGPNAGGKSLALKTLGLFQLMLQSGLLVPVHPSSAFRWVEKILVDIGVYILRQVVQNEAVAGARGPRNTLFGGRIWQRLRPGPGQRLGAGFFEEIARKQHLGRVHHPLQRHQSTGGKFAARHQRQHGVRRQHV
jgi:dsDNA-specific endonuclease/ATPase MutS2